MKHVGVIWEMPYRGISIKRCSFLLIGSSGIDIVSEPLHLNSRALQRRIFSPSIHDSTSVFLDRGDVEKER